MTLLSAHRDELLASGLINKTIERAGLYSATAAEVAAVLGYGAGPGLVFPYEVLNGGPPYARVKLNHAGEDGKRYRSPVARGNHLYTKLLEPRILSDPTIRLAVTEGEKKHLAALQHEIPCVAISGVWSWKCRREITGESFPIEDLDRVTWKDRTVDLVFDSDIVKNPKVLAAEAAFARELGRRGATVWRVRLPPGPDGKKNGFDDYLLSHTAASYWALPRLPLHPSASVSVDYIEAVADFLAEEDPPTDWIFPDLLPAGVIMLAHGEPRSRKSLAAFELALSAATGTPPFGLVRFRPATSMSVLYIMEEDPRSLTRPRVRRLVQDRCETTLPDTLWVSVRRGVDLDDHGWETRLIEDVTRLDVRLLVLDAARRFSVKTDEGPTKVREFTAVLRRIITATGVSIVIVHHDIKPPVVGLDQRRRSQRASGGDWFAASECPVHLERVDERESLVYPQDYKFAEDPAPFTFRCQVDGNVIARLVGTDTTTESAETVGSRGKLVAWLRVNGPASKTSMKKAGFGWETLERLLPRLLQDGTLDAIPGRQANSLRYFVLGEPSPPFQDGSRGGASDAA